MTSAPSSTLRARLRGPPWRAVILAVLAAVGPGCVRMEMTFGRPVPDAEGPHGIVPGVSTRADVLALWGPPEEFVMPLPAGRRRAVDPAAQRIVEERDLLGRRVFTYIYEERDDDMLLIVPFVMLFHIWWTHHTIDRTLVFFDDAGRVEHVASWRESAP